MSTMQKIWLGQLFLFPGLVCKGVSHLDVIITRGHSTAIFRVLLGYFWLFRVSFAFGNV